MNKQSEALRLADAIERYNAGVYAREIHEDYSQAAAELRRLHEVNAELVEACKAALSDDKPYIEKCRAAIAKTTGEQ